MADLKPMRWMTDLTLKKQYREGKKLAIALILAPSRQRPRRLKKAIEAILVADSRAITATLYHISMYAGALAELAADELGSSRSEVIDHLASLLDDALHDQVGPLIGLDDFR